VWEGKARIGHTFPVSWRIADLGVETRMPPTFLIYLFVVCVLPVLFVLGLVFAFGYGVYRWRRGRREREEGRHGSASEW
jgi:hypothetical protein